MSHAPMNSVEVFLHPPHPVQSVQFNRSVSSAIRHAALLCICALASPAIAQRYLVHVYEEVDGLRSTKISSIAQDSTGRMWFATRQQLTSYDGLEWTAHWGGAEARLDDQSLVLVDPLDRIWALPRVVNHLGSLYSNAGWSELPPLPEKPPDGARWTAATTISRGAGHVLIAAIKNHGAFLCNGDEWTQVSWPAGFDQDNISSLQARGDELFVGTSSGLFRVAGSFEDATLVPGLGDDPILALALDDETEELWILSNRWLARMGENGITRVAEGLKVAIHMPNGFSGLVCDGHGGVYFGDSRRLNYYDEVHGVQPFGRINGTLKEGAKDLFMDREGNLWISQLGGVSKLVSQRFANYDVQHGLRESEVTSTLLLSSGEMLLGHPNGLTRISKDQEWIDLELPPVARARVLDLAEDNEGSLWIAAQGRGLAKLDPSGEIAWFDLHELEPEGTNSVIVDEEGTVWVSESRKLFKGSSEEGFEEVVVPRTTRSKLYFRKLFLGSGGRVFLATSTTGLYTFDGDSVRQATSAVNPLLNDVSALVEESDGTILVGTAGGLCRVEGDELIPTQAPELVLQRPVYLLMNDTQGRLWCGTSDGVIRWDGTDTVQYTVEDGLSGREVNRDAGAIDSEGNVWIGTEGGVSVYRDRFEITQRPAPLPMIHGVSLNGEVFAGDVPTTLSAGTNTTQFSFRGLGFVDERRLEFRYRLENFDEEWQGPEVVPGQTVRYTNLPPGRYRFQLQARGPQQLWSEVVSSGELHVSGPLWARPWFILLALSGLAVGVFGLLRAVSRHRYMRELEGEVRIRVEENRRLLEESERTRKLESLGVLAGGIAHDFNNLLTVMMGSFSLLETDESLDAKQSQICRNGLDATSRARALTLQLLTFSKGGAPLLRAGSIAEIVSESARFVLRGSDVLCHCDLPDDLWMVEMDPDQISQVLSNLLLNAKQASHAGGAVRISGHNLEPSDATGLGQRCVEVRIMDDGIGIAEDQLGRIFDPYYSTTEGGCGLGLATSYSIVRRHGGKLLVESSPDMGSTFRVLIPAASIDSEPSALPTTTQPEVIPSSRRILLVDDYEEVRRVIDRMLKHLSHEAVVVADGDSALAEYSAAMRARNPFDVVLMDLTIPGGMGGKELIPHLLELDPNAQAIVISGYSNDPVLAEYRRFGFSGRLSKPVSFHELSKVLSETKRRKDETMVDAGELP
jgi:signal transduction histidine kinase/ligand-binding sensor domain-containing protein/CheY-like chemotaxis protein